MVGKHGGRSASNPIYQYYTHTSTNESTKAKKYSCVYCHKEMAQNVKRMEAHIEKCVQSTAEAKQGASKAILEGSTSEAKRSTSVHSVKRPKSCASSVVSASVKSSRVGSRIDSYFTRPPSEDEVLRAHDLLSVALITSNTPWSLLNNPFFRMYSETIRPGMRHLTAEMASTKVLSRLDRIENENCYNFICASRHLTLVFDSMTDLTKKNLTNYLGKWLQTIWILSDSVVVINEERTSHLLDIKVGTPAQNAYECEDEVIEFARSLNLNDRQHLHLCCDSAGVYVKMRRLLKENTESPFTFVGACLAHQSNLLLKDLIHSCDDILQSIEDATRIATMLNSCTAFRATMTQIVSQYGCTGGFSVWVPTPTRWYSSGVCIKQVLRIRDMLRIGLLTDKDKRYFKKSTRMQGCETAKFPTKQP